MVVKEVELQCEESSTDYAEVSIDESFDEAEMQDELDIVRGRRHRKLLGVRSAPCVWCWVLATPASDLWAAYLR